MELVLKTKPSINPHYLLFATFMFGDGNGYVQHFIKVERDWELSQFIYSFKCLEGMGHDPIENCPRYDAFFKPKKSLNFLEMIEGGGYNYLFNIEDSFEDKKKKILKKLKDLNYEHDYIMMEHPYDVDTDVWSVFDKIEVFYVDEFGRHNPMDIIFPESELKDIENEREKYYNQEEENN